MRYVFKGKIQGYWDFVINERYVIGEGFKSVGDDYPLPEIDGNAFPDARKRFKILEVDLTNYRDKPIFVYVSSYDLQIDSVGYNRDHAGYFARKVTIEIVQNDTQIEKYLKSDLGFQNGENNYYEEIQEYIKDLYTRYERGIRDIISQPELVKKTYIDFRNPNMVCSVEKEIL